MKHALIAFSMLAASSSAAAQEGMKTLESSHGFLETQARLEAVLKEKGMTIFAKIDHAEGARKAGLEMRPEEVTIFGNPRGGTPFMVKMPLAAIDFPLKALVWEDASGKVFLSYNTLAYIVA
ncbi:MAG TPA: DUF302 domain-containing protein, partial [Burkholderiales bacterium]|nr:DUF302 domain-containing protein [Burkholderiales bacterium]